MATTRIMPLHVGKGRTESRAISDIIDYVANPKKTDNGRLITGYACDSRTADAEFLLAKRQYIAATGRVRGADDVIAYHVRQSFRPGEISLYLGYGMMLKFPVAFLPTYQIREAVTSPAIFQPFPILIGIVWVVALLILSWCSFRKCELK